MDMPIRARGRGRAKDIYSSYGDLAGRLLAAATQLSFYNAVGDLEWSRGAPAGAGAGANTGSLVRDVLACGQTTPQMRRVGTSMLEVAIPINVDGRPVSILQVHVPCDEPAADRRLLRDTLSAAAPLVDCLCRELGQERRKALSSATLSERTEELEWLFALTENLHSNSSDPRAIRQLLGAAVERMRASFGAVVAPQHALELRYESMVRIDMQSTGIFERCRPYFLNFVSRRKQPLIANKAAAGSHMPPFRVLLLPIEPHKGRVIGYIVFLKAAALPAFGRRQLFLGRHVGHQVGTLLESQYDLATGLLTRSAFEQDVQRHVERRRHETGYPPDAPHSLLYFDIDRLHVINDVLGFGMGDEAIVRVAELFHAPRLPEDAVISRIGGDSFLVFLPDHDADQAATCARRVLQAAAGCSVGAEPHSIALSLSCGVVRISSPQTGLDAPIATARRACTACKESGGNRLEIYLDIDAGTMRRKRFVIDGTTLRSALTDGRLRIYAQKIVSSVDSSETHGIECLLRMEGAAGSMVTAGEFLPDATRGGILQAIDEWLISNTLLQIEPFRMLLLENKVKVAINISGHSLQEDAFADSVERWLAASPVAPGSIVFEITEGAAVAHLARAGDFIARLRRRGCRFSLDDFGAGLNSLAYLKILPVSQVKIDAGVTHDLLSNGRAAELVGTIARTAESLGIESVAECVESAEVAARVRELGVGYIQGHAAHRPEPLRHVLDSLQGAASERRHHIYLSE